MKLTSLLCAGVSGNGCEVKVFFVFFVFVFFCVFVLLFVMGTRRLARRHSSGSTARSGHVDLRRVKRKLVFPGNRRFLCFCVLVLGGKANEIKVLLPRS